MQPYNMAREQINDKSRSTAIEQIQVKNPKEK